MPQARNVVRPNFGSLLDTNADEIEKPKPRPEGAYLWVVKGMPRMDKSSKKQTEFVEFTLVCKAAGDDVDPEALEESGGITDYTQRATFYLTEASIWRLAEFLKNCGIDAGRSLREMLDDTPNCEVGAFLKHEPSQDGQDVFSRIGKTFPAEDFNQIDEEDATGEAE